MQEKSKKIISIAIVLFMVLNYFVPVINYAEGNTKEGTKQQTETEEISREYEIKETEELDISEKQDKSVIAKWNFADKSITISGKGNMKDWKQDSTEDWHGKYKTLVEKVVINKGITNIGKYAFSGCSSLKEITIPNSVTRIREYAFAGCSSLEEITIPNSVTSIESYAFSGCSSLEKITIPSSVTSIGWEAFRECSSLKKITIPSSITSIEGYTFSRCSSLEEITIPSSVTSIGWYAFYGCSSLKEITIPSSITSIGIRAFNGCSSLKEIKVSSENKNYTSIDGVLYNKNKTNIIRYPANKLGNKYSILNTVTSIEQDTFSECSSLEEIIIPNSVTNIGNYAFDKCSNLEKITIPSSVTNIGNYAFSECSSLKGIIIPNSVTDIGISAFEEVEYIICKTNSYAHKYAEENKINYKLLDNKVSQYSDLYEIKQTEEWNISENGDKSVIAKWNYTDKSITISGQGNMKNWVDWEKKYETIVEKVVINNGITKIGVNAFGGFKNLKEIIIPNSVTSIEYNAFISCSSLEKITIPSSITSIESCAFNGCSSLKEITIPSSVTSIGLDVFNGCSSLKEIKVSSENKNYTSIDGVLYNKNKTEIIRYPANKLGEKYIILDSVTSIGWDAFRGCSSLKEITIPNSVTSIEGFAFSGCSSLKEITIPSSVTSIGCEAFEKCSSLKEITIPNSVTCVDYFSFYSCSSLEKITIPEGVTSIGNSAFDGCSSLKEIIIPNSVTSIEEYAFGGCSSLEKITIPSSITSIKNGTFSGCSNLKEITIPNSVTSIESSAFYGCSSLKEIIIPDSVTSIKDNAFNGVGYIMCEINDYTHKYAETNKIPYILDKEGPEINLSIYSAIKPNSNLEININVTDELAGTNEDSIRYIWSKEKNLNKEDITNKIENNKIIKTPENVIDTYYLYIYAKDKVGNETVYRSKEFNLDYTRNENIVFADKLVANSTEKNIMKNNRIYLQSLVDKVSEDGGGIIHIPSGTYYFSGDTNYTENTAVGIVCKNNVTIEGEGIDRTILKPYGEYLHGMNMFHYTDSNKAKTYLINADFRNFTVDSINETTKEYNYQGKGFMLSPIKDCDWESVKVINADGTGFGVDLPINCTMINCYAKGCGKAGTRSMSGSSGFGIGTGYSNEESILISDCKSFENTKYGFFFEHQSRFNSDLNNLEFNADASNGFIVISCVAKDNLYDYGGIRANDVVYENCVSLKPTKVLTDNEGNIYNNMGIHYEEYSKRVYAINCKFEDPFTDVLDNTQSYYEPVYWAYNNGVVERRIQDGKNVFRVNDIATRGVAATFLYKYMGRPGEVVKGRENKVKSEVLKTSFTDVKIDDYYYEPVEWLNSLKIINASGKDTEFKPTELCTRAMFITMLYRLAGNPEVTLANNFEDVGNQGKWYQNAVNWGISRGIIDDKDTKFYPDKGISRAEIVTFLYKYEKSKNTSFNNKYYLTGGQLLEENQETYTSGVSEFAINNPTREGYNFVGWTGSNIANYNTLNIEPQEKLSITKENVGNNVYTANWKPIEYKINYIANNGTDESKIQNCTYNASQKIIKNDFAKKGYVFKEWNTKEDGTGKSYSEDKVVSNLSSQDGKTIKLYAQWERDITQATGDVTQDGVVNIGDLLKLKQHMAYEQNETTRAKHPNWKLDEEKVLIGDVNKNGKIDVGDILKLRRYIAASTSKEIAEKHSDWLNL